MLHMSNISVPLENDKPPTFGWLMIDKKPIQALQKLAVEQPVAMGMLMYLVGNMSRSNAVMASQQSIAKQLNVSSRSIKTAVAVLEERQFIQIVKIGTANAYIVNTRVAWQGKRAARYAHFHADILAYEVEQVAGKIDDKTPLQQFPKLEDGERYLVGNEPIEPPDQQEMDLP